MRKVKQANIKINEMSVHVIFLLTPVKVIIEHTIMITKLRKKLLIFIISFSFFFFIKKLLITKVAEESGI